LEEGGILDEEMIVLNKQRLFLCVTPSIPHRQLVQ